MLTAPASRAEPADILRDIPRTGEFPVQNRRQPVVVSRKFPVRKSRCTTTRSGSGRVPTSRDRAQRLREHHQARGPSPAASRPDPVVSPVRVRRRAHGVNSASAKPACARITVAAVCEQVVPVARAMREIRDHEFTPDHRTVAFQPERCCHRQTPCMVTRLRSMNS